MNWKPTNIIFAGKPRITKKLLDMTVDEGTTLKLEVEIQACPDPNIKWYKNGQDITTDARIKIERDSQRLENYSLTLNLVKEADGGEYEIKATNEMGSVSCISKVVVHSKFKQIIYFILFNYMKIVSSLYLISI